MSYAAVVQALGNLTLLAFGTSLLLAWLLLRRRGRVLDPEASVGPRRLLLASAWIVAVIATSGSLYFSEVVGFPPCLLCWYQRVGMYPLVLILGVAAVTSDSRAWRYALPLAAAGFLVAVYHVFIQLRPAMATGACAPEAPCTVRHVAVHGFISIPVMAGTAFLLIGVLVLAARKPG